MSLVTSLTRIWLTKSFKPFTFKKEADKYLKYEECEELGLYVHIPFCKQICGFCPYCKELYVEKDCNEYIDHLLKEIDLVGEKLTKKKKVSSLYFGGGTPALVAARVGEIISALKKYFIITEGIGLELHPDNVNESILTIIKDAGISKISIGVQSFSDKFLTVLGREKFDAEKISLALKKIKFETVSMDFIFALPNQTFHDLRSDLETAFSIGANHVAIYPLIDFTFTNSDIKPMAKNEKRKLLDEITLYCNSKGYIRDSIWTFSNVKTAKYSSMTRENFLGFGCSATTLLKDQFKINTFCVEEYKKRIEKDLLPTALTLRFTLRQRMIYFLFWTAYSTKVNSDDFENFFGVKLKKIYGAELWLAKKLGFIDEVHGTYSMTLKGAFYYHYYENFYTLSYIDKMWSVMRIKAFPDEIKM